MIQEQIVKLKAIVNQNDTGHLSLPYRVDLMKQIGSTRVVQKILCECCKKVYPLWENMFDMETPLYKILSDADEYLYKGKGSVKAILASLEKWRNYAEQATDEAEAMAGWAIIALGYAVRYDAASILNIEEYCGEDDNAFDYEDWSVDFICSIAYSGGNPFIRNAGDVEKRREYWLWYLDMVLAMYESPEKPYLAITAKKQSVATTVMPARTQSCSLATIKSQINQIIDLLLNSTSKSHSPKTWQPEQTEKGKGRAIRPLLSFMSRSGKRQRSKKKPLCQPDFNQAPHSFLSKFTGKNIKFILSS